MLQIARRTGKQTLSWLATALISLTTLVLSGCGGGDHANPGPPPKTLSSIAVTPGNPNVPLGLTQQLKATGTYSDGSTTDLTGTASWSSSTPAFATVNATSGLATSVALGSTTITATSGSVSRTTTLTVTAAVVTSISITPNPLRAWVNNTSSLNITGTYSDGTTAALQPPLALTTSMPSVAILGPGPDQVSGVSPGSATITATVGSVTATTVVNVAANPWSVTGGMTTGRFAHTATLLSDGRVLVAGGVGSKTGLDEFGVAPSEVYDPVSGAWTSSGNLNAPRISHTATLLPSGKVLVSGGSDSTVLVGTIFASTEIYDPTSGTWTTAASLTEAREGHTATLLPNGTVLVAGGSISTSTEIYNPVAGTWTLTGSLATPRSSHSATLLPNGKVLVAGGSNGSVPALASAEIYDPATGTWTPTGNLVTPRTSHTATLLPNGQVLVAGGSGSPNPTPISSAEIYDPATGLWKATGSLATARTYHTATLLTDGTVLVVAGYTPALTPTAEIYDPVAGAWASSASLPLGRYLHSATQLANGTVLIAGGRADEGRLEPALTDAEIYQ